MGIPGEAGGGFHQYLVHLAPPGIPQHPPELLPLIRTGAGDTLIRIYIHQLPAGGVLDELGVMLDLGGVGMELILAAGTDPAVCGHPKGGFPLGDGLYDADVCHVDCLLSSRFRFSANKDTTLSMG